MPLDFAVKRFFPHGGVSKTQMLAAIHKGTLRAEKIGRGYLVTPGAIREWRKSCVKSCQPGSACANAPAARGDGSLSMDERKSTRDAALAIIKGLKKASGNTSQRTVRSTPRPETRLKLVAPT